MLASIVYCCCVILATEDVAAAIRSIKYVFRSVALMATIPNMREREGGRVLPEWMYFFRNCARNSSICVGCLVVKTIQGR